MPNKTIYVADDDLNVFERAQELAGNNLSATIVKALKHFIKVEENKAKGYQEISITLGEEGIYTKKCFLGKELGRTHFLENDDKKATIIIVYETAKQQYVVYKKVIFRQVDDLMKMATERQLVSKLGMDINVELDLDINVWVKNKNRYSIEVYPTFEELKDQIPIPLFDKLKDHSAQDFLDI